MKAVFVDGPSVHHLGHAIGIARFNFHALYKLLSEDIGTVKELATPIMVTVTPAMGKGAAKAYRSAGFDVLEITSTDSADDQAIIERISALDSEKVHEVVLVSTDQDYIAALRQKAKQDLKVWWVGSWVNGAFGTSLMSTSLKPFLGTEFEFIDLLDHKEQVMALPKKMPPAPKTEAPVRALKVELSGAKSHDDYLAVLSMLTRLLRKTPHIKYKIEG